MRPAGKNNKKCKTSPRVNAPLIKVFDRFAVFEEQRPLESSRRRARLPFTQRKFHFATFGDVAASFELDFFDDGSSVLCNTNHKVSQRLCDSQLSADRVTIVAESALLTRLAGRVFGQQFAQAAPDGHRIGFGVLGSLASVIHRRSVGDG